MTTKTPTLTTRQALEAAMEPTYVIETIVDALLTEANSGKAITTRLEKKIQDVLVKVHGPGDYMIHLSRSYGMTNLEWGGYGRSQGNLGGSILLAHTDASVPIADRYVVDMRSHLAAIFERNEQRRKLLVSDAPEQIDAAKAQIVAAMAKLDAIHDEDDNWKILRSAESVVREIIGR